MQLANNLLKESLENVTILIDKENGKFIKLNATGNEIIDWIDSGINTRDLILKKVSEKYSVDVDVIKEDVNSFIDRVIKEGYVIDKNSDIKIESCKRCNASEDILSVAVKVTNRCNLFCPYCYASSSSTEDTKNDLSIDEIENLLKQNPTIKKIVITGGEPFTRSDIHEIIKVCNNYAKVHLLTNGTIFNKDVWDIVLDNVEAVQFSIDSHIEEINDRNRGEGSFTKTLSTVQYVKEKGFENIIFAMTPTSDNLDSICDMLDFAYNKGAKHLHVNRLSNLGRARNLQKLDLDKFYQSANKAYKRIRELYYSHIGKTNKPFTFEVDIAGDFVSSIVSKGPKKSCGLNSKMLSIESNGDVYLCQSLHIEELKVGNIREKSLEQILMDSKNKHGCFSVDDTECRDCDYKYFCGGACRACAFNETGNLKSKLKDCDLYKKRILELMGKLY